MADSNGLTNAQRQVQKQEQMQRKGQISDNPKTMQARAPRRHFWLLTLATLLAASGTFSLGQWQLRRAAQKESVQAVIDQKKSTQAIENQSLLATKNIADAAYSPVNLSGYWQAQHTVYLDNRPMQGKPGFWVVTPLRLDGSQQAVLVQRGWIARNFQDRTRLDPVVTPPERVQIQGMLMLAPARLYALGESAESAQGTIRQNLDIATFSAQIHVPLVPALVVQTGPASEGLQRDWTAPDAGVSKHHGYAFQWFGLCALVLGLYAWFQIKPRLFGH